MVKSRSTRSQIAFVSALLLTAIGLSSFTTSASAATSYLSDFPVDSCNATTWTNMTNPVPEWQGPAASPNPSTTLTAAPNSASAPSFGSHSCSARIQLAGVDTRVEFRTSPEESASTYRAFGEAIRLDPAYASQWTSTSVATVIGQYAQHDPVSNLWSPTFQLQDMGGQLVLWNAFTTDGKIPTSSSYPALVWQEVWTAPLPTVGSWMSFELVVSDIAATNTASISLVYNGTAQALTYKNLSTGVVTTGPWLKMAVRYAQQTSTTLCNYYFKAGLYAQNVTRALYIGFMRLSDNFSDSQPS